MTIITPSFLIVGASGIVLQDMIGAITDRFPDMRALTVPTMEDAVDLLAGPVNICFAFVQAGPQGFEASALAVRLRELGAKAVLMGDSAEEFASQSPFAVLNRPFAADDIIGLITTAA